MSTNSPLLVMHLYFKVLLHLPKTCLFNSYYHFINFHQVLLFKKFVLSSASWSNNIVAIGQPSVWLIIQKIPLTIKKYNP